MKNIETLNQEIKKLEEQKTSFLNLEQDLKDARSNIYIREQKALSDSLLIFFEGFNPEAYIEVQRDSIYFKMDHPDYTYRKELFSIYLRERYTGEGKKYSGADLSYYTTSTKGDDVWELKRLRMLGDVADILIKSQHAIVDVANNTVDKFKEAKITVEEVVRGNFLGGTFQLEYNSEVSDEIPFNANEPDKSDFDISNVKSIIAGIKILIAEQKN